MDSRTRELHFENSFSLEWQHHLLPLFHRLVGEEEEGDAVVGEEEEEADLSLHRQEDILSLKAVQLKVPMHLDLPLHQ